MAFATSACWFGPGMFGMKNQAQAKAANDFKCPKDQIEVTSVNGPGHSYKAAGCKQKASYVCSPEMQDGCSLYGQIETSDGG